MKTIKIVSLTVICLFLGSFTLGCGAELNPKFEKSLTSALDSKKDEFKKCYETALEKDRKTKGNMNLVLEFKPDSKKAQDAKVEKSDIKDAAMKKCVTKAAKGVQTTETPGKYVDSKQTVSFQFEE